MMGLPKKKIVLLPIEVPDTDHCWDNHGNICEHFDSAGGHPRCEYGLSVYLTYLPEGGVKKPKECCVLKEKK